MLKGYLTANNYYAALITSILTIGLYHDFVSKVIFQLWAT